MNGGGLAGNGLSVSVTKWQIVKVYCFAKRKGLGKNMKFLPRCCVHRSTQAYFLHQENSLKLPSWCPDGSLHATCWVPPAVPGRQVIYYFLSWAAGSLFVHCWCLLSQFRTWLHFQKGCCLWMVKMISGVNLYTQLETMQQWGRDFLMWKYDRELGSPASILPPRTIKCSVLRILLHHI